MKSTMSEPSNDGAGRVNPNNQKTEQLFWGEGGGRGGSQVLAGCDMLNPGHSVPEVALGKTVDSVSIFV